MSDVLVAENVSWLAQVVRCADMVDMTEVDGME